MASVGVAKKQRLIFLDILRIIFALLIYARHSITMFGCSYGVNFNYRIIGLTSPIMVGFFALSGFSMYYAYSDKKLEKISEIKQFWIKRLITILPSYLLIHFLWIIFNRSMVKDWLIMSPMEFTGTQSAFRTFFGKLHNGGTWFVSCILICYFVYPLIHTIVVNCSTKKLVILLVIVFAYKYYSDFLVTRYHLDTNYPNPFFRLFEFLFGVLICAIMLRISVSDSLKISGIGAVLVGIWMAVMHYKLHYSFAETMLKAAMPSFFVILLISRSIKLKGNVVISTLSSLSYHFFLIQLILWDVSSRIMKILDVSGNMAKIAVSLICCTVISFLMYMCFDKPIKKIAMKVLMKNKTESAPASNS